MIAMSSSIKRLREARHLTIADLSRQTGVSEVDLKRMERKWDDPSPAIARDLAVVLNCNVSDFVETKAEAEAIEKWPYSLTEVEEKEFGGLYLDVAGKELAYAISEDQKEKLLSQLLNKGVGQDGAEQAWLVTGTMCGRLLFVNPAAIRSVSLKHDDDIATPFHAHPEVYLALYDFERDAEWGPVLKKIVDEVVASDGDGVIEDQRRTKLLFMDGVEDHRYFHDEAVASAIYALEANSFAIPPQSFLLVDREGGYVNGWINLSYVAMLDVPLERYLRLTAAE